MNVYSRIITLISKICTNIWYSDHILQQHDEKVDYWGLKKSILYTLFQAVKAITGGVTILKGQLIKGGGALAASLGKVISGKGDAVSNLGKKIVSSAALSHKKPVGKRKTFFLVFAHFITFQFCCKFQTSLLFYSIHRHWLDWSVRRLNIIAKTSVILTSYFYNRNKRKE